MTGRAADEAYVRANRERLVRFTDLQDPEQWYYLDMVEASTKHTYTTVDGVEKWTTSEA